MTQAIQTKSPSNSQTLALPNMPGLKILRKIGQGGMARVYLAEQESLKRPVAVKILANPEVQGFHERFVNESRYMALLSHSNIVDIYDVGERNGYYYIVMEYLPGGDLKSRIRQVIPPKTAMEYATKIAGCLDYLHSQGIVHRDLKPSNILFRGDGNPVLTDFGIAKLLEPGVDEDHDLTVSGSVLGSPHYLSPEQAISSGKIDGRSDLYSLGVIIYEMLAGKHPYVGKSFAEIILAHRQSPIPLLPIVHGLYQPIIDQCMAKRPEQRYKTGLELINDLQELKTEIQERVDSSGLDQESVALTENLPRGRSNDQLHFGPSNNWVLNFFLIILILIGVGYLLQSRQNQHFLTAQENVKEWLQEQQNSDLFLRIKHAITGVGVGGGESSPQIPLRQDVLVNDEVGQEVTQLLKLAESRLDVMKLSFPQQDSALYYYREALKLDPGNSEAQDGITYILDWYVKHAGQALDHEKIDLAKRYIIRAEKIDARDPRLSKLKRRL